MCGIPGLGTSELLSEGMLEAFSKGYVVICGLSSSVVGLGHSHLYGLSPLFFPLPFFYLFYSSLTLFELIFSYFAFISCLILYYYYYYYY